MKIKALRDQRVAKATEARNLLDTNTGEKFTKEVSAQVDTIYDEIDRIDLQISALERQARIDGEQQDGGARNEAEQRARHGRTTEENEQSDRYNAAFRTFILNGERGMTTEDFAALRAGQVQNAQSVGTGAAGGYIVPAGFGGELLEALKAFGGMRDVATILPTAGGAPIPWPTVDETGVEGEIVAENQPASDQDVAFGTTSIGAYKYSSKVFTIPFELLQDQGPGMDVEGFVRRAAALRIARITNRHFTVGTNVNQPQGAVTGSDVGKAGAAGTATSVTYDDLVDLEHSVDPAYRSMPGVRFMWHDSTLRALKKLKDLSGFPLWLPGVSVKEPDTFLSYRYTINQDMPVMAANAKSIAFGDLSQYMIRDIMQVTLFRFDDSAYVKRGQIGFLAWSRHDGKIISGGKPIKIYQNGPN